MLGPEDALSNSFALLVQLMGQSILVARALLRPKAEKHHHHLSLTSVGLTVAVIFPAKILE